MVFSQDTRARATANQEPISGRIDLFEATARALKYNLDAKVEERQRAVRLKELDLSSASMLPTIAANTGFAARNNDQGSNSKSLITGRESLEVSTSQDRELRNSDLTFSWNILDFGLSYVRARQAADEALIAEETRRKVVGRIIEDVRTAYWRAASGERLVSRLKSLERRTQAALRNSRTLAEASETSPLAALTYQRELIGIRREIHTLEGELVVAKSQLAALMNVEPESKFTLVHTPHGAPELGLTTSELIEIALIHRPELADIALKRRINEKEATAALLSMLPGLQLYAGSNYDSNSYAFNGDWVSWGAKASWNLLRVFQYPRQREAIDAKTAVIDEQALALTMAIMTQVHVSRVRYLHALQELKTGREYLDVQNKILQQMRAQNKAGRIGEQALIREEMNTLLAEAKRDLAYASMQNAVGGIYASIGVDLVGGGMLTTDMDVQTIASILREGRPAPVSASPVSASTQAESTPTVLVDLPIDPASNTSEFTFGRRTYDGPLSAH